VTSLNEPGSPVELFGCLRPITRLRSSSLA
jgi:hypothetical protein